MVHPEPSKKPDEAQPSYDPLGAERESPVFDIDALHTISLGASTDPQFIDPSIFVERFTQLADRRIENMQYFHLSAVEPGAADIHVQLTNGDTVDLFGVRSQIPGNEIDPGSLRVLIKAGSQLDDAVVTGERIRISLNAFSGDDQMVFNCHSARVCADPR